MSRSDNKRVRARALRMLWLIPGMIGAAPASAQTLADALAGAQADNPTLEEARLALRAAQENRIQARAGYLPQVDLSGSFGVRRLEQKQPGFFGMDRTVTDVHPSTTTAAITQQLYTGGRRGGQTRLADATIESTRQQVRAVEQNVVLSAIEVFLRVRRDTEIVRLREGHVASLGRQLEGASRRLDVGEVTRTDLAQAQARLAGARAALVTARADLEASRARYLEVIGAQPGDLAPPPTPPATPATLEEAIEQGQAANPDLLQAQHDARAARARVAIERSALLPQLSLVGRVDRLEEEDVTQQILDGQSALAQFSVPLFEGGFAWSRTRQSRINVSRAEAFTEASRRNVITSVVTAWNSLGASREVLAAAREQVAASEFALRGAEREQGLGLRSTIDVLDAERDWQEAQIALARADAQAAIADYVLLDATGGLNFETLRASSVVE